MISDMNNNTLPEKDRYTLKEAALELGCSRTDIKYYLTKGVLRYGFDTWQIQCDAVISLHDIYKLQDMRTFRAKDQQSPEDCKNVFIKLNDIDASKLSPPPKYLYSAIWNIRKLPKNNQDELWCCFFFTFEGEPVYPLTFYTKGQDAVFNIGGGYMGKLKSSKDGYQTLKPALITKEELDKFKSLHLINKPSSEEDSSTKVITTKEAEEELIEIEAEENPTEVNIKPFILLKTVNEIAIAMVEFGNKFHSESKRIPTARELKEYIVNKDNNYYGIKYNERDKMFMFGEKKLTWKRFKARYTDYKNPSFPFED